jgi:hypothetical protein
MSLEQKAKTFTEIRKEIIKAICRWKDLKLEDKLYNEKWVRLEDAQQEVERVQMEWLNILANYKEKSKELEK